MLHEITYRVPYADTDQMAVVYYANYLEYFERSRTEMLRDAGLPYSALEAQGIYLPVAEASLKYLASAHYDELLTIRSCVAMAKGVRLLVRSGVYFQENLLVRGEVLLCCVNLERKPCRLPENLLAACRAFYHEEEIL